VPISFLALALIVIVTPGPDTALVIRNSLSGGRRGGTGTALGVALGQAFWTLATAVGVTALLVASRPAFMAVRIAGSLYLVLLGLAALRRAWSGRQAVIAAPARESVRSRAATGFRQGLLSNLGNPKMAVFFTSLLPQFVDARENLLTHALALGAVFCAMTLVWLTAYALLIARIGDVLRRPMLHRTIEGLAGGVLLVFGIRLALGEAK